MPWVVQSRIVRTTSVTIDLEHDVGPLAGLGIQGDGHVVESLSRVGKGAHLGAPCPRVLSTTIARRVGTAP
jgi:hypothetical protein